MADGNVIGSETPQDVFYDDPLLAKANLHPPSPVRVARDAGLDASTQPVTESELVALLTDGSERIHSIARGSASNRFAGGVWLAGQVIDESVQETLGRS